MHYYLDLPVRYNVARSVVSYNLIAAHALQVGGIALREKFLTKKVCSKADMFGVPVALETIFPNTTSVNLQPEKI